VYLVAGLLLMGLAFFLPDVYFATDKTGVIFFLRIVMFFVGLSCIDKD
jgi:hypothetical protein